MEPAENLAPALRQWSRSQLLDQCTRSNFYSTKRRGRAAEVKHESQLLCEQNETEDRGDFLVLCFGTFIRSFFCTYYLVLAAQVPFGKGQDINIIHKHTTHLSVIIGSPSWSLDTAYHLGCNVLYFLPGGRPVVLFCWFKMKSSGKLGNGTSKRRLPFSATERRRLFMVEPFLSSWRKQRRPTISSRYPLYV